MTIISKDVKIAVLSTIVGVIAGAITGAIIGYQISGHFYKLSKEEVRKELLDNAFVDLVHNTHKGTYPQLYDSSEYTNSTAPWRRLEKSGIDRLYFNVLVFRSYSEFEVLVNLVGDTKVAVDDFNDRIQLRNHCILINRNLVKSHNPSAYHYYQTAVLPKVVKLLDYIKSNREQLIQ